MVSDALMSAASIGVAAAIIAATQNKRFISALLLLVGTPVSEGAIPRLCMTQRTAGACEVLAREGITTVRSGTLLTAPAEEIFGGPGPFVPAVGNPAARRPTCCLVLSRP